MRFISPSFFHTAYRDVYPVKFILCLVCFFLCLPVPGSAQLQDGFIREQIATGLNPTSMVSAPDGRVFITEKNGAIRIIRDDQLLDQPLLKIEVDDSNERGLGHMVLHPDFEHSGYYYVFYSVPGLRHNRISRFTANGDHTVPGSEVIILDLDELGGEIHNGGDMVFGFDGYLYIGTGDGGQNWRGVDLGSTNGKILRVDDAGNPVPDNPWFTFPYLRANLVYAYGFRNPFTLTLHPQTGEIYANDVGGSKYEEINLVEYGRFYGWPTVEGKRTTEIVPPEYKDPLFRYAHLNGYCAVVGSAFYLPLIQQFPEEYAGRYFYSDYCTGYIRMLDPESGQDLGLFIGDGDRVVDLEVSPSGSLYYLERKGLGDGSPEDNTGTNEGVLWKVSYTGSGAPFISLQPHSALVSVGEDATYSVLASGEVPLTYTWLIDGEVSQVTDGPDFTFEGVTADQDSTRIQVEVSNASGSRLSDEVLLRVTTNHRPNPLIQAPLAGSNYKAGTMIHFEGTATDDEDGSLSSDALSWKIDFHHGTHTHPGLPWTSGMTQGNWVVPVVGETSSEVWYRVYLKATDHEGLSKVTYRDVTPVLGNIHVESDPDSLLVHLDGAPVRTPFDIGGVQGVNRYITPPYKQVRGDSVYFFRSWIDGDTVINRQVKTGQEDQYFTALFDAIPNSHGYGLTAFYYDNTRYEGEPVAIAIDSLLDHQYLLKSPYPGVPEDNFGIVWKGYLQPNRTGEYEITTFADDGVFVSIDGNVIIQNWQPGVHHETGKIFLEAGRLYAVHIRYFEYLYGAQLRLRWSSADFPEEVIPTSQLYPADYLHAPDVSKVLSIQTIVADDLLVMTESYKQVMVDFTIINMAGVVLEHQQLEVPIGKHLLRFPISHLPSGMYYLKGLELEGGAGDVSPFIKADY